MNAMTRTLSLLAGVVLAAPPALAQDFRELSVVRVDPPGGAPGERRRLTVDIRSSDRRVSATQEHEVAREGQPAWEKHVDASSALTRPRLAELAAQVRQALAARPAGNLSGSAGRAGERLHRVTIDGVTFELYGGRFASAEMQAAVEPLLTTLEALIEKELPPPVLYQQIRYRRPGSPARTLQVSPTGTWSLETAGGSVQFGALGAGPLKKLDALARGAGPFVPANQGRAVALPRGAAPADPARAFELELVLLRGGEPIRLTGTVGSYAAQAAKAGELVDYLESTLERLARRASGPTGGLGGAVDPD